jgi:D-methionine transport system substrate-binding protein
MEIEMKHKKISIWVTSLGLALILLLGACQTANPSPVPAEPTAPSADTSASADTVLKLRIGVTPVPHAEIVNFVKDSLAPKANLIIEVIEFTDYVLPNVALADGSIDVNFFQHLPYLEDYNSEHNTQLIAISSIHIEPLGIYSQKYKSLDEIPAGAQVAIPNDATNGGRALELLKTAGLLELKEASDFKATVDDITDNPRELKIIELEAAQLPRSLEDTDIAVINGNYALEAGLVPAKDALALEPVENNPYANVLVVNSGRENEPAIQAFVSLMTSQEVKDFIEDKYQGSVIPAFNVKTVNPI